MNDMYLLVWASARATSVAVMWAHALRATAGGILLFSTITNLCVVWPPCGSVKAVPLYEPKRTEAFPLHFDGTDRDLALPRVEAFTVFIKPRLPGLSLKYPIAWVTGEVPLATAIGLFRQRARILPR